MHCITFVITFLIHENAFSFLILNKLNTFYALLLKFWFQWVVCAIETRRKAHTNISSATRAIVGVGALDSSIVLQKIFDSFKSTCVRSFRKEHMRVISSK